MHEMKDRIMFHQDLLDPFQELLFEGCKLLYIVEDLYLEALNSKQIALAFTRGRHKNISIVITSQVLFARNGKYARDISLNTSAYILTRQRDVSQIECIGRQVFGKAKSKSFVAAYMKNMSTFTHGHILIDLQCRTPTEIQVRGNIFKKDYPYELVYSL